MKSNEEKMEEILKKRGISMVDNTEDRKIPEPPEGVNKLLDTYYILKNSVDMEIPYWYNRVWQENNGDITEVRRCKAGRCAVLPAG